MPVSRRCEPPARIRIGGGGCLPIQRRSSEIKHFFHRATARSINYDDDDDDAAPRLGRRAARRTRDREVAGSTLTHRAADYDPRQGPVAEQCDLALD